ncbi:MAG: divergent PAP2 family protein [Firmicutes bacterium]|nr:divergent PAP2 family protein [Bacillota bacterium]
MALRQLFFENGVLKAAIAAWFIAQVLKVIFFFIKNKRFTFERFVGPGGMPSSHSAAVSSIIVGVGLVEGWREPITAMALIFGLIVMYDAAGVRYAAGKQAEILNKIVDDIYHGGKVREDRLRELLGHTPFEVFAGAALGAVVSFLLLAA